MMSTVATNMVEEAETLDEPQPPGIYSDFLKDMENVDMMDEEAEKPTVPKRKRNVASQNVTGPMSKFMKPSK